MPTRSLAALALGLGGSNRSCPRTRSSLRIANESLKKAPTQAPAMIVTNPSTTRLATMASQLFSRDCPRVPGKQTGQTAPDTWPIRASGIDQGVHAQPCGHPARLSPMHLMIQGIRPIPTCPIPVISWTCGHKPDSTGYSGYPGGRNRQGRWYRWRGDASKPADVQVHRR
jgi:hypothetical protein